MITPVEIQSKAFKSGIGYDKKDVDSFINEILESYEELYRSNVEMKDKINMLNEGLQHYKNIEASLQKALVLAE
ncbi:MAG: DivIVA domain-containing protein, partial [Clostridium sp.]|nr:DivIVA domain-containing protein [Clostridium sp.]